jgi:hypothetical protein
LGGQLTDVLLILRTDEAVRAFAAGATLGLGGSAGLALGPLGRTAEASLRLGGLSARGSVVGWSCSKGAFAGLCLEGTVSSVRHAVNQAFYGLPVTPRQLLLDCSVPAPPAAALLYDKLRQLAALWEQPWPHAAAAAAGQGCRLAATAAAAECKQKKAAGAGASSCASSSREWECALDAFEDDDDGEEEFPAVPRHRLRVSDVAGAAAGGGEESDDFTQYAASAPPAPADSHEEVWPGSLFGGSRHGGGGSSSSQQQQQQQQAAPFRVQEAADDDEETQYVLEW